MYREREKEKGKERKNREKTMFFFIFFSKKLKIYIKKQKECPGTRVTGHPIPVTLVSGFRSKVSWCFM